MKRLGSLVMRRLLFFRKDLHLDLCRTFRMRSICRDRTLESSVGALERWSVRRSGVDMIGSGRTTVQRHTQAL
jgi:hypothetical protein